MRSNRVVERRKEQIQKHARHDPPVRRTVTAVAEIPESRDHQRKDDVSEVRIKRSSCWHIIKFDCHDVRRRLVPRLHYLSSLSI
jgi:hypothetical protein